MTFCLPWPTLAGWRCVHPGTSWATGRHHPRGHLFLEQAEEIGSTFKQFDIDSWNHGGRRFFRMVIGGTDRRSVARVLKRRLSGGTSFFRKHGPQHVRGLPENPWKAQKVA